MMPSRHRAALLSIIAMILAGLTSPAQAADPTPAPNAVDDQSTYVVHEWGLIEFTNGRPEVATSRVGQAPAKTPPPVITPTPNPPIVTPIPDRPVSRKPIVYLHPLEGYDASTKLEVTIELKPGTLREVWPTPRGGAQPIHGASFTWRDVSINTGSTCDGKVAPSINAEACTSLPDGVCEAEEMRRYLGSVPHCLKAEGRFTPVLLYNGYMDGLAAPLQVSDGGARLKNTSRHPVGPLLVARDGALHLIESIEPGAEHALNEAPLTETAKSLLRPRLEALGLTPSEANDFLNAWAPILDGPGRSWAVLGFFNSTAINEVMPLTFSPPPKGFHRVLAFTQVTGGG